MATIKPFTYCMAALAAALCLASCGAGKTQPERTLMVSLPPQQYALERIVGDRFSVECMLEKGGSPETFDPTMAQVMSLEGCKAYFLIGNMPFEEKVKAQGVRTVNSTAGIKTISGHSHHGHGGDDPHVWMSVDGMRAIAANMAAAMEEIDPDGKDFYEDNLRKLDAELSALADTLSRRLAPAKGRAFVVWHPSLSYFARDYGLEQVSVEYEGKEAPIKHVEERMAYAASRGAAVFLAQAGADPRQAETVCGEMGIRRAEINPLAYDWKSEMLHIADEIAR